MESSDAFTPTDERETAARCLSWINDVFGIVRAELAGDAEQQYGPVQTYGDARFAYESDSMGNVAVVIWAGVHPPRELHAVRFFDYYAFTLENAAADLLEAASTFREGRDAR